MNVGRMSSVYFSPSIAALLENLQRLCTGVVPRVTFAKRIGSVEFANNGVVEVLVGIKAHRHHASIAIASEDDGVAALDIVGNLRKLVAEVGNRPDVSVDGLCRNHSHPLLLF